MSVRTSARVWERSGQRGSSLLMLLAIADFADDDGRAYPAVPTLAEKCRTTPRHANRILAGLRDSGELEIRVNDGPHGTNLYRVVLDALRGLSKAAPLTPTSPLTGASALTPTSATPDAHVLKPLTPTSDEPSLNRQEPCTSLSRPAPAKLPNCPFETIASSFHELLPELPRVKLMDSKGRKEKVASFWRWVLTSTKSDGSRRAASAEEALAWIRGYFTLARSNDFVMGRTARGADHANWRAGIDYLLSERGKVQVIENTAVTA